MEIPAVTPDRQLPTAQGFYSKRTQRSTIAGTCSFQRPRMYTLYAKLFMHNCQSQSSFTFANVIFEEGASFILQNPPQTWNAKKFSTEKWMLSLNVCARDVIYRFTFFAGLIGIKKFIRWWIRNDNKRQEQTWYKTIIKCNIKSDTIFLAEPRRHIDILSFKISTDK